jgi:hypothetical protein
MKQIKIPFSLEEYNKGGYEVKRGNLDARIICTNANNEEYPIIALVLCNGTEFPSAYSIKGEFNVGEPRKSDDLFLVKQEFEDGDIVTNEKDIAIYKEKDKCYCGITEHDCLVIDSFFYYKVIERLATEEERQKLFNALKKEGKQWNAEKKQIEDVKKEFELNPFDRVLVRNGNGFEWSPNFFRKIDSAFGRNCFRMIGGQRYEQCVPYNDETKSLIETTKDCPNKYKIW